MKIRTLALLIALILLGLFCALNWQALSAPSALSLGLVQVQAPLGLILLGATVVISGLFLFYIVAQQAHLLMESRRFTKELQAQRQLADQAHGDRFAVAQAVFADLLELVRRPMTEVERAGAAKLEGVAVPGDMAGMQLGRATHGPGDRREVAGGEQAGLLLEVGEERGDDGLADHGQSVAPADVRNAPPRLVAVPAAQRLHQRDDGLGHGGGGPRVKIEHALVHDLDAVSPDEIGHAFLLADAAEQAAGHAGQQLLGDIGGDVAHIHVLRNRRRGGRRAGRHDRAAGQERGPAADQAGHEKHLEQGFFGVERSHCAGAIFDLRAPIYVAGNHDVKSWRHLASQILAVAKSPSGFITTI